MSSYRIAIMGSKEAVAGFALLGVDVVAIQDESRASEELMRLKKKTHVIEGKERNVYGVVFVAEQILQSLSAEDTKRLSKGALPAVIPLPSHHGSSGFGLRRLKQIVERAVGSDILK